MDNPVDSYIQTAVRGARGRILAAIVEIVNERGFHGASVQLAVARARVSRRTFYEQFDGLEECFVAVIDLGLALPPELIARAFAEEDGWRDGMRAALAALLQFFDSEPGLTRVWFGEILAAGSWALEHRERNIALVQSAIVDYWSATASLRPDPVLAKGVMAAVFDALTTHVITRREEPFITLLAPLTSLVVNPLLDTESARADVERAAQLSQEILDGRAPRPHHLHSDGHQLPEALLLPSARRARQCLRYLAAHPGASNHQVGAGIAIAQQSQTSRLLARLAGMGLLSKQPGAPGRPNAWTLTDEGERVARALEGYSVDGRGGDGALK